MALSIGILLWASENVQKWISDAFFAQPLLHLPSLGIGKHPKVNFRCLFRSAFASFAHHGSGQAQVKHKYC
jgi:hypothetical protein